MRVLETAAENLRLFGVLFALVIGAFLALGLGLGFALMTSGALASHDDPNTIHACVNQSSGSTKIMLPGSPPNCGNNEILVEWQSASGFGELEARVAALEMQVPDCLMIEGDDAVFEGCNVQIRNGLGDTETTNGTGNLIVGYNESEIALRDRSGSHNLVVGPEHTYTSYAGFVSGRGSTISGPYASVSAGSGNTASGANSSVSAGSGNTASGANSSVSGGTDNEAAGRASSVSGGQRNLADAEESTVSGGNENIAAAGRSTVSGGSGNVAMGVFSTVGGGFDRTAPGLFDWVAGNLFEDF